MAGIGREGCVRDSVRFGEIRLEREGLLKLTVGAIEISRARVLFRDRYGAAAELGSSRTASRYSMVGEKIRVEERLIKWSRA